ncbi:carboxypeptidase regulatory-like domain-containing protein [Amycolatopsis cynarae]|uniref:Carboxypeptidase regulatory-like domain-containing protein n=1 Tax=Amycolatopsis cynarae TaxID=2995223 RepID=A0ABY7B177_9PSEU|nr:SdrD B-like domain-containing protein [Amycolatopsis sp. HUAS 11-8]WAL66030.1 carboxypeptidase regulatory-like domain-containing protein [Amycolatopsis sp. HUAS 11-8]
MRLVIVSVVALLVMTAMPAVAVADGADGPVRVHVVRVDRNNAGAAGILVVVTDPSGASASGTTGPNGTVILPTTALSGGKYRVEATIPASVGDVKPAPEGPGLSPLTEFVDVSQGRPAELTMGVGGGTGEVQLGDRVWFDTDGDGIQDGDEPPLPGVAVRLMGCDGGGAPLAQKTTDAAGRYLFGPADGLRPQTCYTLKFDYSGVDAARLPGAPPIANLKWTVPLAGVTPGTGSVVDPGTGTAKVTVGPPGSVDDTVDAGVIGGVNRIGDLVWADANRDGRQDPGELGVAGVPVSLQTPDGSVVATTSTDARGQYSFSHLPDGRFQVCFDTGRLPAQYADYRLTRPLAGNPGQDSVPDPATGCTAPVGVGPGHTQDLTLDAGLAPPVNRLSARVWIDRDGDGRQAPDEPGIAGVQVKLRTEDGTQVAMTTTGQDGQYTFEDMPDGAYQVCFDLANLPPVVADFTPSAGGNDSAADAAGCTRRVTVGLGKREDHSLGAGLVAPADRVAGRVWFDGNRNGRQDGGEAGVAGVPVRLAKVDGSDAGATTTGVDGRYRFDGIPDGTYQICFDPKAFPPGYAGDQWTRPMVGGGSADSRADLSTGCTPPVTVGVGHRRESTMDAGVVLPRNRLGDLLWLDRNADALPQPDEPGMAGIAVSLKDGAGRVVAGTHTGQDGKYLLDDLPDGVYRVCFDLAALPREAAGFRLPGMPDNCTQPVTVGPKPREDLTVRVGLIAPAPAIAPAAAGSDSGGGTGSGGGLPAGWAAFTALVVALGSVFTLRWWKSVHR